MCEHGTIVTFTWRVPAHMSRTGEARDKLVDIDACIFPLVKALNDAGQFTIASCCGHGHIPGTIMLDGGRELIIMPTFAAARLFFDSLKTDIHGHHPSAEGGYAEPLPIDALITIDEFLARTPAALMAWYAIYQGRAKTEPDTFTGTRTELDWWAEVVAYQRFVDLQEQALRGYGHGV